MSQTLETSKVIVASYLEIKQRTGSNNAAIYQNTISRFLVYIGKADLKSVTRLDAERYFSHLERGGHKLSYKKNQLGILRTFFDYAADIFQQSGVPFLNPIPKARFYRFSADGEDPEGDDLPILTVPQMIEIFRTAKSTDYSRYVQTVILAFTGMRIAECMSLRKANLNIDDRWLVTGLEENARKSNITGRTPLVFFYPAPVANVLFDYLQFHAKRYGSDEPFLFPYQKGWEPPDHYIYFLRHGPWAFHVTSHMYRRTLITHWLNKVNEVPPHIVEMLTNHVITNVIFKHYAKFSKLEKREYYDRHFPREYQVLLAAM